MHNGSTCTILLALRAQVDAVGIAVIGTHAVVALFVAAAQCECVLHRRSSTAGFVEPVDVAAKIYACVAPSEAHVAKLLRVHHLQFFVDDVERQLTAVRRVHLPILASFLCGHDDDAVRSARAVDGRGRTVLQHVKGGNVVGIDVGEVSARYSVNHDEWTQTC